MYYLKEIELKNKKAQKKRLVIEFDDLNKAILAEFLMSDVTLLNNSILNDIVDVLSGEKIKVELNFNRCGVIITKKEAVLNDLYEDMLGDDALPEYKLATIELQAIIKSWLYELRMFTKRQ